VLDRGGVVFGAALDEKQVVRHIAINNREDLARLRGSKYVQSNIGESYIGVRNFLEEGRWVLFSGTPCQIAGLLNVLGGDHARLITVDLVCHGVPSPMVFESYKTYMTHRFNMNIHSISFRDKKYSWIYMNMLIKGLKKKNGTEYVYEGSCLLDPYWLGFMRDLFHRPSCYQCLFAKQERVSDITLADWWHYKSNRTVEEKGCFEKGVSLILTNTLKGKVLFAEVKEELVVRQRELDEAFQTNMCFNTSFIRPQLRDAFWCDYHRLPFNEVVNKYLRPAKIGVALKLRALHRQTFGIKGLRFALRVFAWGIRKAGIVRSTITQ
jgi:coenzyme F420-reducing hydrogenase beta subunit